MGHARLVVTGALGHIGSRYIRGIPPGRFSEVVLVDDLSSRRHASLFDLPDGVPYRFVEADITTAGLEDVIAGAEAVVHLAAITDARISFSIPERVHEVNVAGTERIAGACAAHAIPLVFPSTTTVYAAAGAEVDESCGDDELHPHSPYAASKLAAERSLERMRADVGLRFVVIRCGTIAGSSIGMSFHTAVSRFAWQAATGTPLTIFRTAAHQLRAYLDIADAVRAIDFLIDHDMFDGTTFNVLNENATVERIIAIIGECVPGLSVVETDAAGMNELSFAVSRERFRQAGFPYGGSLERGIRETLTLLRGLGGVDEKR
jgi:UDP-glucose 4-epimerase